MHNQICESIHAASKRSCDQRVAWHFLCARACLKVVMRHAETGIFEPALAALPLADAQSTRPPVLRGVLQRFQRHCARRDGANPCDKDYWKLVRA